MFEEILTSSDPRHLSTVNDVHNAEEKLNLKFPSGYGEFVTVFGEGLLLESRLRIYPPHRVLKELQSWRQRINEYWFWDLGVATLTKDRTLQCIVVADTIRGDELIIHPEDTDTIYVLPRNSEDILKISGGLVGVLEWFRTAGILAKKFEKHTFEPFFARSDAPTVYYLYHEETSGDEKLKRDIGVFESKEQLERAKAKLLLQRGFKKIPEGFKVVSFKVGAIDWIDGF